jgi:hypothetical protein
MPLKLSAPKTITFFIPVIVAVIAVVIHYAKIAIPHVHNGFVVLLVGYLILLAGNVVRGV